MAQTTIKARPKTLPAPPRIKKAAATKLHRKPKKATRTGSKLVTQNFELAQGSLRKLLLELRQEFSR